MNDTVENSVLEHLKRFQRAEVLRVRMFRRNWRLKFFGLSDISQKNTPSHKKSHLDHPGGFFTESE